jgi:hypothetical protein
MRAVGTQTRVEPEGFKISIRVTTSKLRHPEDTARGANDEAVLGNSEATVAPLPVIRNSRRSIEVLLTRKMKEVFSGGAEPNENAFNLAAMLVGSQLKVDLENLA